MGRHSELSLVVLYCICALRSEGVFKHQVLRQRVAPHKDLMNRWMGRHGAVPLLGLPRLKIYCIVRLEIWELHSCEHLRLSSTCRFWAIMGYTLQALRRKIKWIVWSCSVVVDPLHACTIGCCHFSGVTSEVGEAEPLMHRRS